MTTRLSAVVSAAGLICECAPLPPLVQRGTVWLVAGTLPQVLRVLEEAGHDSFGPRVFALVDGGVEDRVAALSGGACDALSLPFDDAELSARLRATVSWAVNVRSLVEENSRLVQLSTTDALTGLSNRRQYEQRLSQEFRRAQRYDAPLALILFDLDHFKQINDRYGHPVGDQVLREVAHCALKSVRDTDFIARIGGEEFAVVLPQTHLAGSITVAERLRLDIARLKVDGIEGSITVSAGLAGLPRPGMVQVEALVRAADAALYRAKREGRDRVCLSPSDRSFELRPSVG